VIMVLRHPEAIIARFLTVPGQIDGVAYGLSVRASNNRDGLIEYR
jgi:hypothetical protein